MREVALAEQGFLRRRAVVPRRRRLPGLVRALLVCVAAGLVGAGTYRLATSSLFGVRRIEISGQKQARTEEILRMLERWRGTNLVTLDLKPLASRLLEHPWIERVTIAKRFPDGLEIRVAERDAVALLRRGGRLLWVGRDGRAIAPYDPRADGREYVLVGGDERSLPEVLGLLDELRGRAPEYFSALSEIDALPEGGFGMMDSIFRKPVRVLRRDAPEKIRALLAARGLIESRGWEARAIDLRFADRIVLVGAYGAGNSL